MTGQMNVVKLSEKYLLVDGKCLRCRKPAKATKLQGTEASLTVAYTCSENHVSTVIYFASSPNVKWFEGFLRKQLGDRIRSRDIRRATRYGWELGGNAEEEILNSAAPKGITQFYWTFYPRTDEDKSHPTVLCSEDQGGCGRLFLQSTELSRLCPHCTKSKQ